MCREGGCGCCVVAVTRQDLSTSKVATMAVNSVSEATFVLFFCFFFLKKKQEQVAHHAFSRPGTEKNYI